MKVPLHEAKEQPLAVDLRAAAQREAIEPLVVSEVAKHGLHGAKALAIQLAPRGGIETLLHAQRVRLGVRILASTKEGDIADHRGVRRPQTLRAQRTRRAVALRAAKVFAHVPVRHIARAFPIQGLPRRTHTRAGLGIVREILWGKHR